MTLFVLLFEYCDLIKFQHFTFLTEALVKLTSEPEQTTLGGATNE